MCGPALPPPLQSGRFRYADRQRPVEIAGNILLDLSDDLRGVRDRQPVGLLGIASLDRGDDLLMLAQPDST